MGNDKRLLKRNEQGEVRYATPCKGNSVQELYEEEREKDKAIMEKLCNFEDKIENGTLIELPCKVGDWLYYIHENIIHKAKVEEIRFNVYKHGIKNEFTDIYAYDFKNKREINFYYEHGYSTVWENSEHYFFDTFLTKAEAEAKLKELKRE